MTYTSEFVLETIEYFKQIHSADPNVARTALLAVYIGCYSVLDSEDRRMAVVSILAIVDSIGAEHFEDVADLSSFIKHKFTDNKDVLS